MREPDMRSGAMTNRTNSRSRHGAWRLLLVMLVILPFSPEITIYGLVTLAKARGLTVDSCPLAGTSLGDIVDAALQAGLFVSFGFGLGVAAIWLVVCYYTINKGWSRMRSRLLLAFVISAVLGSLPFFAPNFALLLVKNSMCPATGGGSCFVFGVNVTDNVNDVIALPIKSFPPAEIISQKLPTAASFILRNPVGPVVLGGPIAAGAFLVYAILTIGGPIISRRRKAHASAQQT